MTAHVRTTLLYAVVRAMTNQPDQAQRYKLQIIGESLLGEFIDMDAVVTVRQIAELSNGSVRADGTKALSVKRAGE